MLFKKNNIYIYMLFKKNKLVFFLDIKAPCYQHDSVIVMIQTVHEGIQILALITPVIELPRLRRKCPEIVNKLVEATGFQEPPWPISIATLSSLTDPSKLRASNPH